MSPLSLLAMALLLPFSASAASADDLNLEGLTWTEQKCVLYQSAWDWALANLGTEDIRPQFIQQNDAFVATGCIEQREVCPQSEKEIELANMLTVMTMNEGMASTFVPFNCPTVSQ
ncbi:hypothetical protein ACFE33_10760 [Falsihalocynthiibacter sp. SS001]|uniref:hypothetical protein n=1 Tax=Falsihalocynthiibacter sp. SS001 TaxID=3349698 RepID=UPI0036D3B31C